MIRGKWLLSNACVAKFPSVSVARELLKEAMSS